MHLNLHSIIIAVVSVVGTLGGVFGIHKHFLGKLKADLPGVMKVGGEIVKAGEDVLGLPGMKAVKGAMDVEVHHVESQLEHSQVLQVVGSALHAFGKTAGSLSNNETAALVTFATNELDKLGVKVDTSAITKALGEVQKAADSFKGTQIFKLASQFDQAISQTSQNTKKAPAKDAATKKEESSKTDTKAADKKEAAK